MRKIILAFALASSGTGLFLLHIAGAPVDAAAQKSAGVQLTEGPETETVKCTLAIIRWTTTNPGGTFLHYGVVHYGTDRRHLSQDAKSPNRRNAAHPEMVFRVRLDDLKPRTTYYYKIESTDAHGTTDGVISSVKTFTTQ